MQGNMILSILNNDSLSNDEKTVLLKRLASELSTDKFLDKRQELIEENRKKAEQNRAKVAQINHDSEINEKMEILALLKNRMGEFQFSKSYLLSLGGYELDGIYEDCLRTMPNEMAAAREERGRVKDSGVDYNSLEDNAKTEENVKLETSDNTSEIPNRMGDMSDGSMNVNSPNQTSQDDLSGAVIVNQEEKPELADKSRSFAKRHWKKIVAGLIAGVILAGAGMFAHNQTNKKVIDNPTPTKQEQIQENDLHKDDGLKTDTNGNITVDESWVNKSSGVYSSASDLVNGENEKTPNQYYRTDDASVMGYVDQTGGVHPADTYSDVPQDAKGVLTGASGGVTDDGVVMSGEYSGFAPIDRNGGSNR